VSSAIQGGAPDTTDDFAVAVTRGPSGPVICSAVLLGPNLVATARHCVADLSSLEIDCLSSRFGALRPAADFFVTAAPRVTPTEVLHSVSVAAIRVPDAREVCGNDIAMLILSSPVPLGGYATPVIVPPMTDHHAYTTAATAIGYGVDEPTDMSAASAGVRRARRNVDLVCIPGDDAFVDCTSDPSWVRSGSPREFRGGDGTCDGDSGSAAFEQSNFDRGNWVAFGVLSRGGLSADGTTCQGSIYTRFDAWGALLVSAATEAASVGGYLPPAWATAQPADAGLAEPADGAVACMPEGTPCSYDSVCCSRNCISHDEKTYTCRACDDANPCSAGYGCSDGVCVAGASPVGGGRKHRGCAVANVPSSAVGAPWVVAAAVAAFAWKRRRQTGRSDQNVAPRMPKARGRAPATL
jgi:hypothetical protein